MARLTKHKKTALKKLVREILIARDGEKCLKCGKTTQLHASHIYPKGTYRRMEFYTPNLKLLCCKHHLYWWHKNPIESWEWLESTIDKDRLDHLRLMTQFVDKSAIDYKLIRIELMQELEVLSDE